MLVCKHGEVSAYCAERDMVICEQYTGNLEDYDGNCRVLVTDQRMGENEYYFLKGKLLARGVELVSIWYKDNKLLSEFLAYQAERRKENYNGRQPFGFQRKNGEVTENPEMMKVVRRILDLRDAGMSYRLIREDEGVHHPDGRKISVDTIRQIIKNRGRYEE